MESGSIAKRYARALLELARDLGQVDVVLKELEAFEQDLLKSSALKSVLTTPSFTVPQRLRVLQDVLASLKLGDLTSRFLLFVAKKQRMHVLSGIVREYRNYYDDLNGLIRVTVTSAVPLSGELEKEIVAQVERMAGRRVLLTKEVDKKIIGGVVTRVGGLLIDGSLSTQLARLRNVLLQEQLS